MLIGYGKEILKETITIKTAQSSAACGFNFEENQKYIVYASQYDDDYLEVSLCSRTGLLSNAIEDLQELGAGYCSYTRDALLSKLISTKTV